MISYSAAISACEKGGQWQGALQLFHEISSAKLPPYVIGYNATISAFEKGRQWQLALLVFTSMPQAKLAPDLISHNAAISSCEKAGKWQLALQLFSSMVAQWLLFFVFFFGFKVNSYSSQPQKKGNLILICFLGCQGSISQSSHTPDVISYSATISACEKSSEWQVALRLFASMPQATLSPNVISYNAMISSCDCVVLSRDFWDVQAIQSLRIP